MTGVHQFFPKKVESIELIFATHLTDISDMPVADKLKICQMFIQNNKASDRLIICIRSTYFKAKKLMGYFHS